MPGQGRGLAGDPLHQAAVAALGVDIEANEILEARLVETRGHPLARGGHAHTVGYALA